MIPFILAGVGGYLIGNAKKDSKIFKEGGMMAKGGIVKVGDILTANTGVKVKVVEYDTSFGGRVRVERLDEHATGKPSQFMPLSKFKKMEEGGMMAKGGKVGRGKSTYIPNEEIESLTTWNGVEFKGDELLDGAYARGRRKYADGGMMADGGMTEEEFLNKTVVYDNGGESFDRYTVFTPDNSVYGMSENGEGFNQYVGDSNEVPKGKHLGKKLKSVPKELEWAVTDRMESKITPEDLKLVYYLSVYTDKGIDKAEKFMKKHNIIIDNSKPWRTKGYGKSYDDRLDIIVDYVFDVSDFENKEEIAKYVWKLDCIDVAVSGAFYNVYEKGEEKKYKKSLKK